ncbi:MAG: hypothetical protein PVG22_13410 [Chromatiales bacterium]|jgi:Tol biopolymer transport system component
MQNYPNSHSTLVKIQPNRSADKLLILTLLGQLFFADVVFAQTTDWVSKDSEGNEADDSSLYPSISADGRFVAFHSYATNLVPDDTNGVFDVFVHDRETGETMRVSVDSEGYEADGSSLWPSISADGRYIAFTSLANNLVPGENYFRQAGEEIFVRGPLTNEPQEINIDIAPQRDPNRIMPDRGRPA